MGQCEISIALRDSHNAPRDRKLLGGLLSEGALCAGLANRALALILRQAEGRRQEVFHRASVVSALIALFARPVVYAKRDHAPRSLGGLLGVPPRPWNRKFE